LLFKLDENTPWILKKIIESAGNHTVDSIYHENLTGITDKKLIYFCKSENRILITLDRDFLNPILYPTKNIFGIIVLHPLTQGKKAVKDLFEKFLIK